MTSVGLPQIRRYAFFGTDAQSWMNLQTGYDTEQARELLSISICPIP